MTSTSASGRRAPARPIWRWPARCEALEREQVRRLVLVRPAVEAGERLGFLPGDMAQKIDPYLRPLYDALYEMLGFERVAKLIERNVIEVAPLAFMRGRTLNDSFIILDEAQNTTVEQMKMFLTRIGFGSTAVVTGDITQVDLPRNVTSGLRQVLDVLKEVEGISITLFNARDVVRHPLVQRIVNAYERDSDAEDNRESLMRGQPTRGSAQALSAGREWRCNSPRAGPGSRAPSPCGAGHSRPMRGARVPVGAQASAARIGGAGPRRVPAHRRQRREPSPGPRVPRQGPANQRAVVPFVARGTCRHRHAR